MVRTGETRTGALNCTDYTGLESSPASRRGQNVTGRVNSGHCGIGKGRAELGIDIADAGLLRNFREGAISLVPTE